MKDPVICCVRTKRDQSQGRAIRHPTRFVTCFFAADEYNTSSSFDSLIVCRMTMMTRIEYGGWVLVSAAHGPVKIQSLGERKTPDLFVS